MKALILMGLIVSVVIVSGCATYPGLIPEYPNQSVPNISMEFYKINSDKFIYMVGEEITFSGLFPKKVYEMNWYKPVIYKKDGGSWTRMDSYCGCIGLCGNFNLTTSENKDCMNFVLVCALPPVCSEMNPQEIWVWDQTFCNKEKVDCIGSYDVYCSHGMEPVGPGTYKVEFTYTSNCTDGTFDYEKKDFLKIVTNEFTIEF